MAYAIELAGKPPLAVKNIKKSIYEGSSMTLQDGLVLERKLFFDSVRSDDAVQLMRLYVAAGQDPEKVAALIEETGGDPEKIAQKLSIKK